MSEVYPSGSANDVVQGVLETFPSVTMVKDRAQLIEFALTTAKEELASLDEPWAVDGYKTPSEWGVGIGVLLADGTPVKIAVHDYGCPFVDQMVTKSMLPNREVFYRVMIGGEVRDVCVPFEMLSEVLVQKGDRDTGYVLYDARDAEGPAADRDLQWLIERLGRNPVIQVYPGWKPKWGEAEPEEQYLLDAESDAVIGVSPDIVANALRPQPVAQ